MGEARLFGGCPQYPYMMPMGYPVIPNRGIPHHCPFRPGDHFFESPGCPWDAPEVIFCSGSSGKEMKRMSGSAPSCGHKGWDLGTGDLVQGTQGTLINLWKIAIGDLPEAPVSRCSTLLRLEWHPCRIHWDWVTLSCRGSVSHNFRQYISKVFLQCLTLWIPLDLFKQLLLGTLGP